jgi:signal transduction histidine kinase
MRLLLRNLLDNALRYSAGAPLPPELHLRAVGQGIRIEVRDHGPGVSADQLAHLAEPFFRPDTARTRAQGGVGLGLYLCKLVAQAHGGTLVVRNAAPGLAVTVTLPGG